jgi:hypothetical protein
MGEDFMPIVILSSVKKLSFKTSLINPNTNQSLSPQNNQVKEGKLFQTWVEDLKLVLALKKTSLLRRMVYLMNYWLILIRIKLIHRFLWITLMLTSVNKIYNLKILNKRRVKKISKNKMIFYNKVNTNH